MSKHFLAAVAISCLMQGASASEPVEPIGVTLADLLANIGEYLGEKVSVMGYFAVHANLTLFESQAHEETRSYLSSLVVADYDEMELHRSDCVDKMVEITGEVAQGAASNFILVGVTRITLVSTNEICWEL